MIALSTYDLSTVRRTCRRLKEAADDYIRIYYPAIGSFKLQNESYETFRHMDASSIRWVGEIHLYMSSDWNSAHFENIKQVLNNVRALNVVSCDNDSELHSILKYCLNLRILCIHSSAKEAVALKTEWLHQQYPSLEYVQLFPLLTDKSEDVISKFETFFKMNPNIRIFLTSVAFVEQYGRRLADSGIKFERLIIWHCKCAINTPHFPYYIFERTSR